MSGNSNRSDGSRNMEIEIGKITHYYNHLGVATLSLVEGLKLGDKVHICGYSTDFIQRVTSMEVNHHAVLWVKPGDHMALRLSQPAHVHDKVYRILEEEAEPAV